MREWTSHKWISYWVFQIILSGGKYHSILFKENFHFFSQTMSGIKKMPHLHNIGLYRTIQIMNTTITKKYLEYYKNVKEREFCFKLSHLIQTIFKNRIMNNNWLSKKTKKNALIKLEKMTFLIGYTENFEKDPDCEFLDNDGWGNFIKYSRWYYKDSVEKYYNKIPNKNYWVKGINVFNVNAMYNNLRNEMIIPNAILQLPFVDLNKNISYNLAYLGTIIAHEMVHGFDSEGCKFDQYGAYNNWWTSNDIKKYKKKQQEIIKQYELLAQKDKFTIKGKITLTENIADIVGFSIIEDVLDYYLTNQGIVGEEQYEYFKELYYYYTRQWKSVMKLKTMHNKFDLDRHSLAKYRVNGALMRSKRFQQIFNIQKTDGMYFKNNDVIW